MNNKNRVKNENYIVIQGWMIKELNLSGNELLLFAIIYGFSQDKNSKFTGSLQYLADWTNTSKQTCSNNLKYLLDKKYIGKEEFEINGVKYCKYFATIDFNTIQKNCIPIQKNCINNIDYNLDQTKLDKSNLDIVENEKISKNDLILKENVKQIIEYLNEKAEKHFRYNTSETINLIKARFKEGYTLDDFYIVINKKVQKWLNNQEMNDYLRPKTLFGNKFESYLNEKTYFKGTPKLSYSSQPTFDNTKGNVKIHHISDEEFNKLSFEDKMKEMEKFDAIANMTKNQQEFYNQHCLARDENGNLIKF